MPQTNVNAPPRAFTDDTYVSVWVKCRTRLRSEIRSFSWENLYRPPSFVFLFYIINLKTVTFSVWLEVVPEHDVRDGGRWERPENTRASGCKKRCRDMPVVLGPLPPPTAPYNTFPGHMRFFFKTLIFIGNKFQIAMRFTSVQKGQMRDQKRAKRPWRCWSERSPRPVNSISASARRALEMALDSSMSWRRATPLM